jgi:hypothetical protein
MVAGRDGNDLVDADDDEGDIVVGLFGPTPKE